MNSEEVAQYLGVTAGRVRWLAIHNKLRGDKVGGRDWIFRRADVAAYAANRRRVGRPRKQ